MLCVVCCCIYTIILCVSTPSLGSSVRHIKILYWVSIFRLLCFCPISARSNFIFNFHFVICFSVSHLQGIVFIPYLILLSHLCVCHNFLLFAAIIFFSLENSGGIRVEKKILMHTHKQTRAHTMNVGRIEKGSMSIITKRNTGKHNVHATNAADENKWHRETKKHRVCFFSIWIGCVFSH